MGKKGLNFLHRAYKSDPNNFEYQQAFNKYKNVNNCPPSPSSSISSVISDYNHLEITIPTTTKKQKTRREPPPPSPMYLIETKTKESESKECDDVECKENNASEYEFERWMKNKIAINGKMWTVYLQKFKNKHFNDIRMMEYLDDDTLKHLINDRMHLKIFQIHSIINQMFQCIIIQIFD